MKDSISIVKLQDFSYLMDTVADRIWNEWSRSRGKPLSEVIKKLSNIVNSKSEFVLVAVQGSNFAGTVSFVESDLAVRPSITPWIAAVYVEPSFRGKGVGSKLIRAAECLAWSQGADKIFLHCSFDMRGFYSNLGYCEVEEKVGEYESFIFSKSCDSRYDSAENLLAPIN